jgi:uncharacterized protein (TIGR02246 family)
MKYRILIALVVSAINFVSTSFAQQTVDAKIDQQIRVLAAKYDAAIDKKDATGVASLYAQDAIWVTYHDGKYHGRPAIEHEYDKMYFKTWNKHNYATTVERVTAAGNEVRASGTWNCAFRGQGGFPPRRWPLLVGYNP